MPAIDADLHQMESALAGLFARYADCLLAQILQSTACNATHSIEQRAAKWMIAAAERSGPERVPLTHDQLGMLLGVGRSYASRVVQKFKAARLVETRPKAFFCQECRGLQAKACLCDTVSKRHFDEVPLPLPPWAHGSVTSLPEAKEAFAEAWARAGLTSDDIAGWQQIQDTASMR